MRLLLLLFVLFVGCATEQKTDPVLFTLDNQDYRRDDLPDSMRQKLFNAQVAYYQEAMAIIRESVIDLYLAEKGKPTGKSLEQMKAITFATTEPTEEDKKKFYEEIKDKLPYSYEIIKHELGSLIIEKQLQEREESLLAEISKRKGVQVFVKKPDAPQVSLESENFPSRGPEKAKVQLVEFGDFSCPNCRLAVDPVESLLAKYKDKVEFTWRYYFIHSGGASLRLAKGGHCAHAQKIFWPYYKYVFDNQTKLRWKSPATFIKDVEAKVNEEDFKKCYDDPETEKFVTQSHQDASKLGVDVTPTFFVNGKRVVFNAGFEGLEQAIQEAL